MRDPYLYKDVDVLVNKLEIKDIDKLNEVESFLSQSRFIKIDDLITSKSKINYTYLKKINKHILGDIYEWAGKERSVDILKSEHCLGGESVYYAPHNSIVKNAETVISEMDQIDWSKLTIEQQAENFSNKITALWQVHPFREGNTRTCMMFAVHYALEHGFSLDRQLISENSSYTRASMCIATLGTEYNGNLVKIIKHAITSGDNTYFKTQLMKAGFLPEAKLVESMKKINSTFGRNVSIKEIKELCKEKTSNKELLIEVENDFKNQELKRLKENKMTRDHDAER